MPPSAPDVHRDVHVTASSLDVVGIERLLVAPFEDVAFAAHLAVVQAAPGIADEAQALVAGGAEDVGRVHGVEGGEGGGFQML